MAEIEGMLKALIKSLENNRMFSWILDPSTPWTLFFNEVEGNKVNELDVRNPSRFSLGGQWQKKAKILDDKGIQG